MALPRFAIDLSQRAQNVLNRIVRPLTLGVRAIVIDGEQRVFLVRHSYVPGWHFPGGGVEPGETLREAMARELVEEGNIVVEGSPSLHGMFFNKRLWRDHIAVYVVRSFSQRGPRTRDWEIVETGFFPIGALPEGATSATRNRLAELAGERPVADQW